MPTHTRKEHRDSTWGHLLTVPLFGISAYLLCTVTPYLIDADCSRSGYAPVSLTSCLPETEIAQTNWSVGVPIDGTNRGKPLIQVLPSVILNLTLWATGVMLLTVMLVALICQLKALSVRPIAIEVTEPLEESHSLKNIRRE